MVRCTRRPPRPPMSPGTELGIGGGVGPPSESGPIGCSTFSLWGGWGYGSHSLRVLEPHAPRTGSGSRLATSSGVIKPGIYRALPPIERERRRTRRSIRLRPRRGRSRKRRVGVGALGAGVGRGSPALLAAGPGDQTAKNRDLVRRGTSCRGSSRHGFIKYTHSRAPEPVPRSQSRLPKPYVYGTNAFVSA